MVRESRRRGIRHESKVYFAEEFIHSHLYFLNRLLYIQVYHERSPDAFYYIIGRGSKKNICILQNRHDLYFQWEFEKFCTIYL